MGRMVVSSGKPASAMGNWALVRFCHLGRAKVMNVKIDIIANMGFSFNGVIHVGTNDGYEMQWYEKMGIPYIVGFEPYPPAIADFKKQYPHMKLFEVALSDVNNAQKLKVYNTGGTGSSLFYCNEIPPHVAEFGLKEEIEVPVRRFDDFVLEHPEIDWKQFDCVVLDTQGNEHDILRGMGEWVSHFKFWNIELSRNPLYDGESSAQEVIDWMKLHGHTAVTPIEDHNDVMFVRSDLLK